MIGQGLGLSEGGGHQQTNQILDNIVHLYSTRIIKRCSRRSVQERRLYTLRGDKKIVSSCSCAFNAVIHFISENGYNKWVEWVSVGEKRIINTKEFPQ